MAGTWVTCNQGVAMVVHHHTLIIAKVLIDPKKLNCNGIQKMLSRLVEKTNMKKLFEPIAIHGKYGYTGTVGIVTSHMAFHYFETEQALHFDVYSCMEYNLNSLLGFLDSYWKIDQADVIFIERDKGPKMRNYKYKQKQLLEVRGEQK